MSDEQKYPEHEKLKKIQDESQTIGEFLEFGGYTLCESREAGDNGKSPYVWTKRALERRPERQDNPEFGDYLAGRAEHNPEFESWNAGYYPVMKSIQKILADYFEIDLDKIEAEKRQMLDKLREMNT